MATYNKNVNLISLNVRGIISANKREKVFLWCENQNADITLLQETHCTKSKLARFKAAWKGSSYYGLSDSSFSKGVGILFKENINVKVTESKTYEKGRALLLNVELHGKMLTIINVYAPNNEKQRSEFFKGLHLWILENANAPDSMIFAGDFNCCLLKQDRSTQTHLNDKSRTQLNKLISSFDLRDQWCECVNSGNHYTWNDDTTQSRLDYVFISRACHITGKKVCTKIVISDEIGYRVTDHKAVECKAGILLPAKGPGYWKLNCSHLNNEVYKSGIKTVINDVSNETGNNMPYSTVWEILKRRVKMFSIEYATNEAKKKRSLFKELENNLQDLNTDNLTNEQIVQKENIQRQLSELYSNKCRGTQVRARAKWLAQGEQNNKYFMSLEKHRQANNVIECIKLDNGKTVVKQSEVLCEIGKYYERLYSSANVDVEEIRMYLDEIEIPTVLSEQQKQSLEGMPDENECENVLYNMKDNRSPGMDGIPIEFYKCFWGEIKELYLHMIEECWQIEDMPFSMKTAVLALIHKGDDKDRLKYYRPISLMNSDYKLLAFVFAERMQKVLSYIVHTNQSGYIRSRYIGCNIRNIIDIYDICENENIPGALLNIDFEKAFDSVEHNFMIEVFKKFNFGKNFIKWISILYNDPIFRIKNNGWISKPYKMLRGQWQGCPISALTFVLVVEIMAISIRNNTEISGVSIGNIEYKIIQYADDATIVLGNMISIENVIDAIKKFGNVAGPKLNVIKTKGIWLGPLKEQGLRKHKNIKWTGNPVKCLGIYVGHNAAKCYELNWNKKLDAVKRVIAQWKQRSTSLTIQGKILVVKTLVLPKIIFPATILCVPEDIVKELKCCIYEFIWGGKRDRIKRSVLSNSVINGGMNMVDIDSFLCALKASWITKLVNIKGNWKEVLYHHLHRLHMPINYITKMNFQNIENYPVLEKLPKFYQDVFIAFNQVKHVKPIHLMNKNELFEQTLFGNELFKCNNKCLYFKNWLLENVCYVKDIITQNGNILSDEEIFYKIKHKRNIMNEMYIIKNIVIKHLHKVDKQTAQCVRISNSITLSDGKKFYVIKDQKSKFYYRCLKEKNVNRSDMENRWSKEFNFENSAKVWKSIYWQKISCIHDNKLAEFNYKILHNILPCGYILSKWNADIKEQCEVCNDKETMKHMLFSCARIHHIWEKVSNVLNVNIQWKHLVCGFIMRNITDKVNYYNIIFSVVMYAVFKNNSNSKYENKPYVNMNIEKSVKHNLVYYKNVLLCLKKIEEGNWIENLLSKIIEEI